MNLLLYSLRLQQHPAGRYGAGPAERGIPSRRAEPKAGVRVPGHSFSGRPDSAGKHPAASHHRRYCLCHDGSTADQLCDVFGISAIRNKYPAEISGGKKQRTAVARPLIPPADPDRRAYEQLGLQVLPDGDPPLPAGQVRPRRHHLHGAPRSFDISSCDRVEILRDGVIWRTLERGSLERSTFQDQLLDAIWDMDKE